MNLSDSQLIYYLHGNYTKEVTDMKVSAREERFEPCRVCGVESLFTSMRLDRKTIPIGYHCYEVRYDDDGKGDPIQLANYILVNHYGTILTSEAIDFHGEKYLDINPKTDWEWMPDASKTIEEYENK